MDIEISNMDFDDDDEQVENADIENDLFYEKNETFINDLVDEEWININLRSQKAIYDDITDSALKNHKNFIEDIQN